MKKYRFKTKEEFIKDGLWVYNSDIIDEGYPVKWNDVGEMNHYIGQDVPEKFNKYIEKNKDFYYENWNFIPSQEIVEKEKELSLEELRTKMNLILNNK
jgi:hypothetical protein